MGERRFDEVAALIERMERLYEPMLRDNDPQRFFHGTYLRTTLAVQAALAEGGFVDNGWTERWDVVFADLYLKALEAWQSNGTVPGPWRVAFEATKAEQRGRPLPPLRHVLLGMNAHVNYDLPQSLIAVITDSEFRDGPLMSKRRADHEHIDGVLASRVAAEDGELMKEERPGDRTLLDKALTPFNRLGTKRFLKEARRKVWHNANVLSEARQRGPDGFATKLAELDELSAVRVADLRRPGQVLLRLALRGFGVQLTSL